MDELVPHGPLHEDFDVLDLDQVAVGNADGMILLQVDDRLFQLRPDHALAISQLLFAQCAAVALPKDDDAR